MKIYYSGQNGSALFGAGEGTKVSVERFTELPLSGVTDVEIGWLYILLWRGGKLYITGATTDERGDGRTIPRLLNVPEGNETLIKYATAGRRSAFLVDAIDNLWQYDVLDRSWTKVANFIPSNEASESENVVKISQGLSTMALSNLGRVFNIPTLIETPPRVKFVDVCCGSSGHAILLAENGDVYSMGIGSRGQLGHGDLEDSENPRLVEPLAGVEVTRISAAGWHCAAVTNQGDLYAWGWNSHGQLGVGEVAATVVPVPTLIEFKRENGETVETNVRKVQCGQTFTVCMMEDGSLWGCGSNKYGQLGQMQPAVSTAVCFRKLNIPVDPARVRDFKCQEWATAIVTD